MKEQRHILDSYELLSTKLAPPRPQPSLVTRSALLARLDEGLERRLTLVSAPAGFGKTTLVSEWIAGHGARPHALPVAWVSLEAGDNDPVRFWRYVVTACQVFDAAIGESALELLRTSRRLPFETVLTAFINELARLEQRGVLVLEDYHTINSHQIHEALAYFVDHLPPTLHLLILTRRDPALPLARLRAHNDLNELHAADLRFSLAETRAFLQQALPFPLSSEAITRLEARTEGWVTGLRLLALALQGRKEPQDLERVLQTFSGGQRHILEYLVADVLASQPEALQEFLLHTAFLNRLSGSLCDAVTGRSDSERMLEQLEHANLFLLPLDDVGQWYRYHALFAEAMQHEARRRLGEDCLRSLHDKASRWYEQRGLLAEAVEVALPAGDFARAAALIDRITESQGAYNEPQTLLRWIAQLPEEVLQSHPAICLTHAVGLLFTLDRSDPATLAHIQVPLEMAERRWQAEGNRPKLGEVQSFRSQLYMWQEDLSRSFGYARQALELLPEQEVFWRASSTLAQGMEEMFAGRPAAARQALLEARALFEAVWNPYGARAATSALGELSSQQGELHAAARFYQQVISEAAEDPFDMTNALIDLAGLSYEWNELEKAEQEVSHALELGKQHIDEIGRYHAEQLFQIPGSLLLARILHARGEVVRAMGLLQELVVLTEERRWQDLHREVLAEQARLGLAAADLAAARRWSTTVAQLSEDFRLVQREREALIVARLRILRGEAEGALELLDQWLAEARAQGRSRSEIEILALKALAYATTNKQQAQARQALVQALTLARPEGFQRLFLDEGEAMAAALQAVLPEVREEPLATYVRTLLYAFARQHSQQGAPASSVPSSSDAMLFLEPLSAQERRVLRLLASGRSNPEIAQELIVSVNTVKTQVQSIYRKLNVKSRWEARDAARQLKLL